MKIKAILFDFGGTIDTGGIHWFRVINQAYTDFGYNIDESILREAYIYAERKLEALDIDSKTTFREIIYLKFANQFEYLISKDIEVGKGDTYKEMTIHLYEKLSATIRHNSQIIKKLHKEYKIAIVSNFYGNLQSVFDEFSISDCVDFVIDSKLVSIRKPDPQIWQLAIDKLGFANALNNKEVLVVGDSYKNDIAPAKTIGAITIWIKNQSWDNTERENISDLTVESFLEVPEALLLIV